MEKDRITNGMSPVETREWLELYWNYFQLHSKQRMKLVQFYLSLITVLFGALYTVHFINITNSIVLEIIICVGSIVISLAFLGLDYRTAQLIKYSEDAIKSIEELLFGESSQYTLFLYAEEQDKIHKGRTSYSRIIQGVECLVAFLGFVIILLIATNSL